MSSSKSECPLCGQDTNVIRIIEAAADSEDYSSGPYWWWDGGVGTERNGVKLVYVHNDGYYEGSDVYMIFEISGKFYKVRGYQSSYDGVSFYDNADQVEKIEKVTVTYG